MFTNLFINCPRVGVIADGTATVALFVLDEPFVDALCVGVDRGSVVEIEQVLIVGEDLFVDGFHGAAVVSLFVGGAVLAVNDLWRDINEQSAHHCIILIGAIENDIFRETALQQVEFLVACERGAR